MLNDFLNNSKMLYKIIRVCDYFEFFKIIGYCGIYRIYECYVYVDFYDWKGFKIEVQFCIVLQYLWVIIIEVVDFCEGKVLKINLFEVD